MTKKQKIKNYNKIRFLIHEEAFKDSDRFICPGCERTHYEAFWTLDHIEKRSQSMYWYDKPENLSPLCHNCNIMRESKGDNYLKNVAFYIQRQQELKDIYNNLTLEQKKE